MRPFRPALLLSILATVACSSGTPPAESPAEAAAPPSEAVPASQPTPPDPKGQDDAAAADDAQAAKQAKEAGDEAEPAAPPEEKAPAGPPPSPSEILLAENVAFELDGPASAVRLLIEERCAERAAENDAALQQCMKAERSKFPADVLRFRRIGGQLRWTVYKRKGEQLQVVFSAPFTLTEESDYGTSLLILGGGSGYQPLLSQSRKVPLRFPSTDAIEIDDPVWGQLVYRAKQGLAD